MFKIIEASYPTHHLHSLSLRHPRALALTYAALNFAFGSWVWPSSRVQAPSHSDSTMDEDKDEKALKQRIPSFVATSLPSADRLIIGPMDESKQSLFSDSMQFELDNDNPSSSSGINTMHDLAHASLLEAQQIVLGSVSSSSSRRSSFTKSDPPNANHTRVTLSSKAGYIHDRILNPSMVSVYHPLTSWHSD